MMNQVVPIAEVAKGFREDVEDVAHLESLVDQANQSLRAVASVGIRVGSGWERNMVRATHVDTDAWIRDIPSGEIAEIARRVRDLKGFLFDLENES